MGKLNFKGFMAAEHITQKDLAELLGLSRTSIYLKVNEKQDWTLAQIRIICKYYKISADIFL